MTTAAAAAPPATIPKPADASLWWDSFILLFEELDAAPLSPDPPESLVKKIKNNHAWFLESITRFKPPNQESRSALDSPEISLGSHRLVVKPELKDAALRASKCLCLNEVQSYILVNRSFELKKSVDVVEGQEFLQLVLLQYYLERQCLLKCVRCIFAHALYMSNVSPNDAIKEEALQLVDDGFEGKLLSILQDLFSSVPSERTEVDFMVLWVEESLIEDNLILDILFLLYYDNFINCNAEQWKILSMLFKEILSGSFNVGKLAVSVEARNLFVHAKAQIVLILIETLDLENLLHMVHDEVPLRQGGSKFSLTDVQEIDALVSGFSFLGAVEAEPVIVAWAVFICLLLSLPDGRQNSILMEIDHVGYVRQAFEGAPFNYLLEILRSDTLRDSYGPVSGFLCIMRTFVSAFIASYDLSHQGDDNILNVILDVICEIYHGEESLSMQFWDRDSFVDAPIRSLLHVLESEYPFHTVRLVRLLSSLCEGTWAAKCVYNFLDNMSGITLPFEIPGGSRVVNIYDVIETRHQLYIPGVEGLIIPSGTRGHCLKVMDENVVLVRWELAHSGIFLLLLHLAQEHHRDSYDKILLTLRLIFRIISSNTDLCFSLCYIDKSLSTEVAQQGGQIEKNMRVDVVKIACSLVFHFVQDANSAGVVSICINLLAEMLKCSPSQVIEVALTSNLFRMDIDGSSSGTWLFSGGLARMLLANCGENVECLALTTSVLDFTAHLVEKGAEDDMVSALVVFSLQYVLVNHLNWIYKLKHARWELTLKVLEVMKSCIKAIRISQKLDVIFRDILLNDSSIHNVLCRIICMSTQAVERTYVTSHFGIKETEDLLLAVRSALDIIYSLLATLSKEACSNTPDFFHTMLSSATKRVPVVPAIVSMISFFQNPPLQVTAARVLSMLCFIASRVQPYSVENVGLVLDAIQVKNLNIAIYATLEEEHNRNEGLIVAVFNFLISAARYQPALLVCLLLAEEQVEALSDSSGNKDPALHPSKCSRSRSIDSILKYLRKSDVLVKSAPQLLLSVLVLLKALWEGGIHYMPILENFRSFDMFWKDLSSVLDTDAEITISFQDLKSDQTECKGYMYQCQGTVLEIMAHELFLHEKLLQDELSESLRGKTTEIPKGLNAQHLKVILSTWCDSSKLDKLIKSYSGRYDNDVVLNAKISVCLCMVHLVSKLSTGNCGSLSISLVKKIGIISNKLREHPAFSALLAQYSSCHYSKGKELTSLVLNDLYYQLQGQLEGREVASGHFQELSRFLLDLGIFQCSECNYEGDIWLLENNAHLFDISCLTEEFRIDLWEYHSDWKATKEVTERMFLHMHHANSTMLLAYSQCFALRALTAIINLYEGNILKTKSVLDNEIPEPLIESSIKYLCKNLQAIEDSIAPSLNPPVELLRLVATQSKLLLVLSRILFRKHSSRTNTRHYLPLSILLVRCSSSAIKFLDCIRPSTSVPNSTLKFLLLLLLISVEFCYPMAYDVNKSDSEAKLFSEVSLISMGLVPILCKYVENTEFSDLSVASLDLILKGFLPPNTWLPILQKHLQVQSLVQRLQQKQHPPLPVSGVLTFLLTLAKVKGGAQMLHSAGTFTSLKMLFADLDDGRCGSNWGLGLAVVASMVNALGDDDFSSADIVDSAICYFFSEKAYITSGYLSAPVFPFDDQSKKRTRSSSKVEETCLTALKVTEQTLMLMCVLARHQASWSKGMKEMDSGIRETAIHLLAIISSRGIQLNKPEHPFCLPTLKEEVELNGKPAFVNSKHGWFTLSSFGNVTRFSDTVAIQIYRIAFLVLNFLCMHTKAAAKRAEELEFIGSARFPGLPSLEILHGLQDQAIAIVSEVCDANRSKPIHPEVEGPCVLLFQILEKALYLELCVLQSCGSRQAFGRIEDFSKEFKILVQAVEQHSNLKALLRSLAPVIALVYPGLLQNNSLY